MTTQNRQKSNAKNRGKNLFHDITFRQHISKQKPRHNNGIQINSHPENDTLIDAFLYFSRSWIKKHICAKYDLIMFLLLLQINPFSVM